MKNKTKLATERAGAYEVAKLLCDALDKFPKNEQDARIKKILDIEIVNRRSSAKARSLPKLA